MKTGADRDVVQKYEVGVEVVGFGVEAAKSLIKVGMPGPDAMRFLGEGLEDAVAMDPEAVLNLLSIALLRIAELEEAADG